jgi:hypothetical protein
MNWQRPGEFFRRSTLPLMGHLLATALILAVLLTLAWLLSYFSFYLNGIHHFPDEMFKLVDSLELDLMYLDIVVSGIILLIGIWQFVRDILEDT